MIIKDGGGTGYTAAVDVENRLQTFAITQHEDKHTNLEGLYWSLYATVTPAGANDYFWYIENTGIFDLAITDLRVKSSVVSDIYLKVVSGTPSYVTGTDVEVTNRNLGSSQVPSLTAKYDTDITGLTDEGTLFFMSLDTTNEMFHLRTSSNVIIPQGKAVALQRQSATGEVSALISLARVGS